MTTPMNGQLRLHLRSRNSSSFLQRLDDNVTNFSCSRSGISLVAGAAVATFCTSSVAKAVPVETLVSISQHPTDAGVLLLQYEDGLGGLMDESVRSG